jgi:hypothetical protein
MCIWRNVSCTGTLLRPVGVQTFLAVSSQFGDLLRAPYPVLFTTMESLPDVFPGLILQNRPQLHHKIIQYAVLILSILIHASGSLVSSMYPRDPEPYHTSALSGEAWVVELLTGHPERIRCELGVHAHVFGKLISELRALGHTNSKYLSLEEQLAIFLYTAVTGLSIRHVGERFQRSNETISR